MLPQWYNLAVSCGARNNNHEGEYSGVTISNLSVFVAVGKKSTTVWKKIQLALKLRKFEITHTNLVVPGLTANVIIGVDFLKKYGGEINFKVETYAEKRYRPT